MFPLYMNHLRPSLGDAQRLYWDYDPGYSSKVLGYSPIGYWPLWEPSGFVAKDISGNELHGAYTGVTLGKTGIGDGRSCAYFDGANDFVDIYSAGLNTAFDGAKGTMAVWVKVSGVGVWTDSAFRWFFRIGVNTSTDQAYLYKQSQDNKIVWVLESGNTELADVLADFNPTDWFHMGQTWDENADEFIMYIDGVQHDEIITGLGTWAGALGADDCCVGARLTDATGSWDGYIAHPSVYDKVLTPTEILDLATV